MPSRKHAAAIAAALGASLSVLAQAQAAPAQISAPVNQSDRAIAGSTRSEAIPANDRGRVADDMALSGVQILLHRSDAQQRALNQLSKDLHDPKSSQYHKWLSAKQFAQRFGVAQSDIGAVTSWLTGQGFHVDSVSANKMTISFSGTAGQVRQAFQTEIHNLDVNGQHHFANISPPTIPAALKPAVVGVLAINDFKAHTNLIPRPNYTVNGKTGPSYIVVPEDLATIYNLKPLFSAGIDGTGQTVVVIEDTNIFRKADWDTFRSTFGLSGYKKGSFSEVHPTGSTHCKNPLVNSAEDEAMLDAEWSSASAPNAAIVLASCDDTGSTFGGFIALQNLLEAAAPPAIVSISYGSCEVELGEAMNQYISNLYQQADTEGVSVFVASGDESSAECDNRNNIAQHGVSVSGFMSTPYNVSVGGLDFADTYLKENSTYWNAKNDANYGSAKSYIPEFPWEDSCANVPFSTYEGYATPYGSDGFCNSSAGASDLATAGGSGGPSGCATGVPSQSDVVSGTCAGYQKPSWQVLKGVPKDGVRDTPDISLMAANGLWGHYYVFCDTFNAGCSGAPSKWSGAGGTSFASPILAGMQALVNEKAGGAQGNPNPVYYSLAADEYGKRGSTACASKDGVASSCVFYDVVMGDNDVNCKGKYNCYTPSGVNGVLSRQDGAYRPAFAATTGYDFPSGIGSINAFNLVNSWPQ